mmetsp:Transcript_36064/g.95034  ORF Transcript_36064/g.95034 Transcript_36064/m.95034 type:complete len:227 (+) Transcript_36064:391-1071(+)
MAISPPSHVARNAAVQSHQCSSPREEQAVRPQPSLSLRDHAHSVEDADPAWYLERDRNVRRPHELLLARVSWLHFGAHDSFLEFFRGDLLNRHVKVVVELGANALNFLHAELAESGHQLRMHLRVHSIRRLLDLALWADRIARTVKVIEYWQELCEYLDTRIELRFQRLVQVAGLEVVKVRRQPGALLHPLLCCCRSTCLGCGRLLSNVSELLLEDLQLLLQESWR